MVVARLALVEGGVSAVQTCLQVDIGQTGESAADLIEQ